MQCEDMRLTSDKTVSFNNGIEGIMENIWPCLGEGKGYQGPTKHGLDFPQGFYSVLTTNVYKVCATKYIGV